MVLKVMYTSGTIGEIPSGPPGVKYMQCYDDSCENLNDDGQFDWVGLSISSGSDAPYPRYWPIDLTDLEPIRAPVAHLSATCMASVF